MQFVKEGLQEIKAQYPIQKVYIEKPFMFFGSGGSTAKTMAALQKFNGTGANTLTLGIASAASE